MRTVNRIGKVTLVEIGLILTFQVPYVKASGNVVVDVKSKIWKSGESIVTAGNLRIGALPASALEEFEIQKVIIPAQTESNGTYSFSLDPGEYFIVSCVIVNASVFAISSCGKKVDIASGGSYYLELGSNIHVTETIFYCEELFDEITRIQFGSGFDPARYSYFVRSQGTEEGCIPQKGVARLSDDLKTLRMKTVCMDPGKKDFSIVLTPKTMFRGAREFEVRVSGHLTLPADVSEDSKLEIKVSREHLVRIE